MLPPVGLLGVDLVEVLDDFRSGDETFSGAGRFLFTELRLVASFILDTSFVALLWALKNDCIVFILGRALMASALLNFMEDMSGVTACHSMTSSVVWRAAASSSCRCTCSEGRRSQLSANCSSQMQTGMRVWSH